MLELLAQKRNGKKAPPRPTRALAVAALLGVIATPAARALEPNPPWRHPDHPRRAILTPPAAPGPAFLADVPAAEWPEDGGFAVRGPGGRPLAARRVYRDARRVWVLVARETAAERRPHELYFGGPADGASAEVSDPQPIRLEFWRSVGGNAPDSWPRMEYMFSISSPARDAPLRISAFNQLDPLPPEARFPRGERGDQRRRQPVALYRFVSWALLPAEGRTRFVLDADACAFLLVNGQLAVSAPHGSPNDVWVEGEPMDLMPGVHRLEVYVASRGLSPLRVGWFPPGASAPEVLGRERLLSGARADSVRLESSDRTLHVDFVAVPEKPYGFFANRDYFHPVRFENRSINWLAANRPARWRFDDGRAAEGDVVRHIFNRRGPWRAALEVRDALGFVASLEREVEPAVAVPRLYALNAALERLTPVAFPGDRLAPMLRVEGEAPADARFTAEWSWRRRDGEEERGAREFTARELPLLLPLGPRTAGDVEALVWRIRHEGAELFGESVQVGDPPAAPLRVSGDALYAGLRRVVLRPGEGERRPGQRRLTLDDLFGDVLFADDFLASAPTTPRDRDDAWYRRLALLLDGPDRPRVWRIHPPRAENEPEAWAPLLKFAISPTAVLRRPTLVVVSVGLADLRIGLDPEVYERHAAALTDALMAATPAPVAWLTPPPYPERVEPARAYAAAIRRTARARGVPVVDLFSAFVGAGAVQTPERFFEPGTFALTAEGRELAAQISARALLEAAGENPP